jgi:hypothetical protein
MFSLAMHGKSMKVKGSYGVRPKTRKVRVTFPETHYFVSSLQNSQYILTTTKQCRSNRYHRIILPLRLLISQHLQLSE